MGIINDYLRGIKRPVIAIIALFFIRDSLIASLQFFTDLAKDQLVFAWVVGGITFAFHICWLMVLCWAGIRSIRMTKGVPLDGAIGGAMAAAIAGLFIGIVDFLFNISMPSVIGNAALQPTGAAAAIIISFAKIFVGVIGIVAFFIINLIIGAVFGALGSLVEEERILAGLPEKCLKAQSEADKVCKKSF